MLIGIPPILSPDLMKVLMEMGHGDEIVFGDGNFPAHSVGKRVIRYDGSGIPELLEAVLPFFPLDHHAPPVTLMAKSPCDASVECPIWDLYARMTAPYTDAAPVFADRQAFYEQARGAYCVVQTGEPALYANIILRKGVVSPRNG